MTLSVYLNGEFVDQHDARVGVYDGGWLHGAGLFETMRAENGRVFRLESHIERLRRSAAQLLTPIDRDALPGDAVFGELLERNRLPAARVRLTVSAGSMREDFSSSAMPQLTICVTAAELSAYSRESYENGVTVVICPFRTSPSDPVAGHKTTGYLPRLLGLRYARQARCAEALWFTTGNRLAEGSISNVFVVRDGMLNTPPLNTPVLPGIARGLVLEAAKEAGIEVRECPLFIDDLLDADELFLTNALMQVMPVVRVEKRDIREARIGPMTRRLLEEYRTRVHRECGS